MSFLFKSRKQREREARKARRRAIREAENADLDTLDRIKKLEKEGATSWEAARTAAQSGQQAVVQRHLTSYRAAQVLIAKLEQKRWVFRRYVTKIEAAGSDQEFASALAALNKVTSIDPEAISDVFDTAADLLGEQQDADRFWNQLYERETGEAGEAAEDHVPSMDDLEKQLTSEAADSVGDSATSLDGDLAERLEAGRQRVRDMLDNEN